MTIFQRISKKFEDQITFVVSEAVKQSSSNLSHKPIQSNYDAEQLIRVTGFILLFSRAQSTFGCGINNPVFMEASPCFSSLHNSKHCND